MVSLFWVSTVDRAGIRDFADWVDFSAQEVCTGMHTEQSRADTDCRILEIGIDFSSDSEKNPLIRMDG